MAQAILTLPAGQSAGRRNLIDQSASERVLHRALFVIKFLRAMLLHVALAMLAVLLFATSGISGLYPMADSVIDGMRIGARQQRGLSGPIGEALYWAMAAIVMLMALAFMVWTYRSITAVRPKALRFQALALLLVVLYNLSWSLPALQFAFTKLDPFFALLSTLGVVSLLAFPICVAMALWEVSRATEGSSFVATLDRRLVDGRWSYLNKLLDLPRTPFRRPATALAWLLAFGGTLLLIASFMHLLTLGAVTTRLSTLAAACDGDEMVALCKEVSANWATTLPWALLLAFVGIKCAAFLQSTAKRLGGLGVSDVLRNPGDRFVLYLRPFDTDHVILPKPHLPWFSRLFSFRPYPVRIEEELFDVADGYRPLIAVGQPGNHKQVAGGIAYRDFLDDSQWQAYVADKIRRADHIVLVMNNSAGVRWEIEQVIAEGAAGKTLFLLDPAIGNRVDWDRLRTYLLPLLKGLGADPPAAAFEDRPIGLFFNQGAWVEIINMNRSATSYRTAFSFFLAEQRAAASS